MWIDSHCHLDLIDPQLSSQPAFFQGLQDAGIKAICVPGTQGLASLPKAFSQQHEDLKIFHAFGFHPWFIDKSPYYNSKRNSDYNNDTNIDSNCNNANDRLVSDCLHQLQQQFLSNKDNAIAIGECGLDKVFAKKHAHDNHYQQQQAVFELHCEVAKQSGKAMIIHNIKSQAEILHQLKQLQIKSDNIGVVHAFSGSYQQAKAWLDAGFYLGIGGTITYPRAKKTRATLKKLPLDRLLLETDAPAMPIFGQQGKANTPHAISQIAQTAASLLSVDQETLASQLWQNFFRLFQLEPF